MAKKDNTERDDLAHMISTCLADEGYVIDAEIEREILRLAKFVIAHESFEEPTDEDDLLSELADDDELEESLFDDYDEDLDDDDDSLDEDEDTE